MRRNIIYYPRVPDPTMAMEFFFYHQSFRPSKCATCFVFMIFLPPRLLCPTKQKLLLFLRVSFGQFSFIDAKAFVGSRQRAFLTTRTKGNQRTNIKMRSATAICRITNRLKYFFGRGGEAQMCCYESNFSWLFVKTAHWHSGQSNSEIIGGVQKYRPYLCFQKCFLIFRTKENQKDI